MMNVFYRGAKLASTSIIPPCALTQIVKKYSTVNVVCATPNLVKVKQQLVSSTVFFSHRSFSTQIDNLGPERELLGIDLTQNLNANDLKDAYMKAVANASGTKHPALLPVYLAELANAYKALSLVASKAPAAAIDTTALPSFTIEPERKQALSPTELRVARAMDAAKKYKLETTKGKSPTKPAWLELQLHIDSTWKLAVSKLSMNDNAKTSFDIKVVKFRGIVTSINHDIDNMNLQVPISSMQRPRISDDKIEKEIEQATPL
eukprot:m.269059 g.269059  ORF g.269059 m.269059 type:complete len:262 (+) comp81971_c0_seq1:119-904(+)